MGDRKAVIKKYENRRLYDTGNSRYVNLDDVARLVREGVDVQVVDARSGEDLTRVVLTQIIMEDAKGRESGPPLDLLRQLIVASDRATHEFLSWYLTTVTEMYQKAQSALHVRPLDLVRSLFAAQTASQQEPPNVEETDTLRRRIAELELLLEQKTKKRRNTQKSVAKAK